MISLKATRDLKTQLEVAEHLWVVLVGGMAADHNTAKRKEATAFSSCAVHQLMGSWTPKRVKSAVRGGESKKQI